MPVTKLVIFDLDGTLINAYKPVMQSIHYAMRTCGFKPPSYEVIKRSVGWGDRHLIAGFVGWKNVERVLKVYRKHHETTLKEGVKFLPGSKNLLDTLARQKIQMAIVTNRPTKFSWIILRRLKIAHYFDYVICGDKAPRPKPHPEMINMAVKKLNVKKSETFYAGDMTIDIQTGNRARVRTVAVTTGSCKRSELLKLKPFRVIKRISQIKQILKETERTGT